jgi:hypothetical protein
MPVDIPVQIDDQPISATFFGEGKWLTDFVTPDALEVTALHTILVSESAVLEDRLGAMHRWVGNEVSYIPTIRARIWVNGEISFQDDYWQQPSQVIRTKVGNCCNKAFLLASLVRKELPAEQVHVVLGNLHQPPAPGGHAWVQTNIGGEDYIMESTRGDMKPMVAAGVANIYEPILYFNDQEVKAIEGRTLLTPFAAVYADWLKDYLDWAFIEGRK